MKHKKKLAVLLTGALGGGTYDSLREREFVEWKSPEVREIPARVIKQSRLKYWTASVSEGTVVEPVMEFKIPTQIKSDDCPPPDPIGNLQPADWGVARVHVPEVLGTQNGSSVKVCVIDTGADSSHPDLKIAGGRNFSGGNVADITDRQGHGTHTAGLVAAVNNEFGVVGASQAQLLIAKVLGDNGSGSNASIANGIAWCAQQPGVKIISGSLGGPASQAVFNAVRYASSRGIAQIYAAGNDGNARPHYPAAFAVHGLYAVSALDRGDRLAQFSSYGRHIKMTCPGVDINSTAPGGRYQKMSGTSMATPICAGIAALYIAAGKKMQYESLGNPTYFGAGIPDARGVLK